ncbi:hypothetical protein STENM223S_00797 [Streptomyces tendae]
MTPAAPTAAIRQLAALARHGDLSAYAHQIQRLGGCERPIRMEGHRLDVHAATGEIVREITDRELPAGQPSSAATTAAPLGAVSCAEVYRKDTFHLVTAGLSGGERHRPAVAPDTRASSPPSPHRPSAPCTTAPAAAGVAADAFTRTTTPPSARPWTRTDTTTARPSCGTLTRGSSGPLTTYLRQHLASRAGLSRSALRHCLKVSYAKVAQSSGAVPSTSTPSSASTARTAPRTPRRPGPRPNSSPMRFAGRPGNPRHPVRSSTAARTPSA